MDDDVLDFEDLFEIVTPGAIDRRIHDLDAGWQQLRADSNNDAYIVAEIKRWEDWANKVLDSYFAKFWATSILAELEAWKKRYQLAYNKVANANKLAPTPDSYEEKANKLLNTPAFWIFSGLAVAIGIYFYGKKSA